MAGRGKALSQLGRVYLPAGEKALTLSWVGAGCKSRQEMLRTSARDWVWGWGAGLHSVVQKRGVVLTA